MPSRPLTFALRLAVGAIAFAPQASRAQHSGERPGLRLARADTSDSPHDGVLRCFGIYVDRDCPWMLQYEVGYRTPVAGRAPRLIDSRPRERGDRKQLVVAGGLFKAVSRRDALGLIYDSGTGDESGTRAIGVRWARGFAHETRIDVTAGATSFPLTGDSVVITRLIRANGAFVETALHGSNMVTLVVRDEAYASRRHAEGGNLLFVGARAEAVPALVLTITGAVLFALAFAATGPGW